MDKLITIFVSSYNVEEYISECLESFLKSKCQNDIDVLVINDGSTDKTSDIAHKYEIKYPELIRVIDQENGGLGSTFNAAVKYAQGKYILSMDADDWLIAEEFDKFVEKIKFCSSDMISFGNVLYRNGEIVKQDIIDQPLRLYNIERNIDAFLDEVEYTLFIHRFAYRTKLLRDIKFKADDEYRLYNDGSWDLYPLPYVKTITRFTENIYAYRLTSTQSTSIKSLIKNKDAQFKMVNNLVSWFSELSDDVSEEKKMYIRRFIWGCMSTSYYLATFLPEKRNIINELNDLAKLDNILFSGFPIQVKIIRKNNGFVNLIMRELYRLANKMMH